jgi:NDP-sugar pyrophosphorylase family protein
MKYAIVAAGEGSRLVEEGVSTPKPLVCINGEPMIERLIKIFIINNAQSVNIIVNNEMEEVYRFLRSLKLPVPLNIIRKSTPSSMHSFYELSSLLDGGRFCLTTVDTIFREDEFSGYIKHFDNLSSDGLFAVTGFIDDEKPLYIDTDDNMIIRGLHDSQTASGRFISGGIYCLDGKSLPVLKRAIDAGISRLRNYQRELIAGGLKIEAYQFSKIIDVDHYDDIKKAESFLSGN